MLPCEYLFDKTRVVQYTQHHFHPYIEELQEIPPRLTRMATDPRIVQAETAEAPSGALSDAPGPEGVTPRAVLLGLVLVVGLDVLAIYVRYVLHASLMSYSHIPMAMLIVFVLMMVGGAVVSRLTGVVLSSSEWHTILAMGLVGAAIPVYGLSGYLIGYMAAPFYFATPENEWDKYLHPYIPDWLVPSNEGRAVSWFYEGLPQGAEVPWGAWLLPLFWWVTMIAAAFVALACVAVIFRKQWVHNERLVFPAMAPLIDMASRPGSGRRLLPEFTGSYLFWIGFGLSFGVIAWNCLNYFFPGFPRFPIYRGRWFWIDRQVPPIWGFFGLFTIFFSYFASLDVLFSIWLFDLLFIVEGGTLNKMGFSVISPYYYRSDYYWQTKGAYFVLVLSMFWVARRHIRDVFHKALNRDHPLDDRDELLSYRTALIGLLLGLAYMWVWLFRIGFDPLQAVLLLLAVIFTYVGMAKILADTGMPYTNVPAGPWGLVGPFIGGYAIGPSTRVAFRFASRMVSHYKGLFLPALAHAGRIAEGVRRNRRALMGAIALAFLVSLLVSVFLTLHLGYRDGAYNFHSYQVVRGGMRHFKSTATSVKNLFTKDPNLPVYMENPGRLVFFGIGGAAMAGLIYLRHRFVWWPLHPVGLAISGSYLARRTSFTIFMAWLIKLVMLKVGGPSVYRKSRPFFVGALVGYVLGIALSTFVDMIWFPERGHYIHRF